MRVEDERAGAAYSRIRVVHHPTPASASASSNNDHPENVGIFALNCTVTAVVVLLFAAFGSNSLADTLIVLLMVPGAGGARITIVTVALPPLANVPMEQVITGVPLHVP